MMTEVGVVGPGGVEVDEVGGQGLAVAVDEGVFGGGAGDGLEAELLAMLLRHAVSWRVCP
jgi:hypothetical protein